VSATESKYIENKSYLSRYSHQRAVTLRESEERLAREFTDEWYRSAKEEWPKFVHFLTDKCGFKFHGRVLEIGAGGAWLSAELSKLPNVVNVVTTDYSPKLLKEHAPKVFKLLKASSAKITRMPADYYQLGFPASHFDFVVCSSVLHRAANMVQVLREMKRVLKPGGHLVAFREPVWPLVQLRSRAKVRAKLAAAGITDPFYSLAEYREFFRQAGLQPEVKQMKSTKGFRHHMKTFVKGLAKDNYAFLSTKRSRMDNPQKSKSKSGSRSWKETSQGE
jgi:ubiquinone/menaquinone biosynthesis C-methylase UbiE